MFNEWMDQMAVVEDSRQKGRLMSRVHWDLGENSGEKHSEAAARNSQEMGVRTQESREKIAWDFPSFLWSGLCNT